MNWKSRSYPRGRANRDITTWHSHRDSPVELYQQTRRMNFREHVEFGDISLY